MSVVKDKYSLIEELKVVQSKINAVEFCLEVSVHTDQGEAALEYKLKTLKALKQQLENEIETLSI